MTSQKLRVGSFFAYLHVIAVLCNFSGQDQLPPGAYSSQGYSPPQGSPPEGYPPAGYPPRYPPLGYPSGPCSPHHPGCGLGAMIEGCAAACRAHHLPYGSHCWHRYCHGKFKHGC